jgi:hypothetical protein
MEFINAYDLVLYLYNQGQLKGLRYTGHWGEVVLDSTISDQNLVKLLESIWYDWSVNFDNSAKSVGNYTIEYSEKEGLFVEGYCEDEDPYNKNEFVMDEILRAIIKYLSLSNIDYDLDLGEQLDLLLELNNGEIENFELGSPDYDDLNNELQEKLSASVRTKLTIHLQELLNSMHGKLNPDTDFNLYIESSHLYKYSTFWEEKYVDLKSTLGQIEIKKVN